MTGSEVLTAASGTIATGLGQWTWKEVVWKLRNGSERPIDPVPHIGPAVLYVGPDPWCHTRPSVAAVMDL